MDGKHLDVWYDGDCDLCRRSRSWCETRPSEIDLRFRDFRLTPEIELPLPRGVLESAMVVRDTDGVLVSGFDAWRRILRELPQWRILARLAGLPPLRWLGQSVYRWISDCRGRISR